MMINLKKALQIVTRLLNDYLNDPDVHITEKEEQAVILIRDMAEENNWNIQESRVNLN
jgi:hypothetical protein